MRVLMLDPSLFTLPYDRALCGGLAASGCDVALVGRALRPLECSQTDDRLPLVAHFYRRAEALGLRIGGGGQKLLKSAEHVVDMMRLPALCDRLQPDVIHVQWLALPLVDRHLLPALRRRAPLVMTVHNSVPFHGAAASRFQLLGAGTLHDRFDGLIAHTQTTREHLLDDGIDARRIALVPHGLLPFGPDAADDRSDAAPPDPGLCRVLFFGEIKPYKGLKLLLEAIAGLAPVTRAKLRLHVTGRPRMEMAPLIQLCHAHGFAAQVTWDLRFVRDDEVAGLFAACDVVALPYHDVDSSGVLSLATGAGKAVLASDIGGFRDQLVSDQTALLAPLEAVGFGAALARLVDQPALRRHLGDGLRRHGADAIPSWATIGRATAEAYRSAAATWRAVRTGRVTGVGTAARVSDAAMPEAPARIHNLDSLRAVAVLLVVVFHYRLLAVGWIGVWIFFVISGFLISRILLDYKTRFALADYLGVFYARRALRIFPIYYLYVGLWSAVALIAFMPKDFAFLPLVTYTFNFVKWSPTYDGSRIFSHLWSLAVEEQFYLVYPLAVFALGRRNLVRLLIAIVVLSPLLRYAVGLAAFAFDPDPDYAGRVVFVASFLHADAFAIGGLIALFEPAIRKLSAARFASGLTAGLVLGAGVLAANAVARGTGPSTGTVDPYFVGATAFGLPVDPFRQLQHVWVYSLIDLAAGLAICVILRTLQRPLPIVGPLNAIGKISYGVYLYHFALISVADRVFAGVPKQSLAGLGLFALYLGVVLALSVLSHRVIETPFNAHKPLSFRRGPVVRVGLAE